MSAEDPRPSPPPTTRSDEHRRRASDWLRLLLPLVAYAALLLLAWRLGYFDEEDRATALQKARAHGALWFEVVFVLVYAAAAAMALPLAPLAYGAGAVFGFVRSAIFIWIGSMLGAAGGYYLAHGVWAASARRLLGPHRDKLRALGGSSPFVTALRLQILPIVPFGIFNYAAAISRLPVRPFLLATAVGIIPGTLLAALVGAEVIAGLHGGGRTSWLMAVGGALVVLGLSFVPGLVKRRRKDRKE